MSEVILDRPYIHFMWPSEPSGRQILDDQFQIALEPYEDEVETIAPLAVGAVGGEGA